MRSVSRSRNRLWLTVAGLLVVVVAVWLIAASFALMPAGSGLAGVVPASDETVSTVVQPHRGWALPAALAASIVAVFAGVVLLLVQIPTAPASATLRLSGEDGQVLATLEPRVLERALAERVQLVPGVEEVSVRVSGSTRWLQIVAEVAVAQDAQLEWTVAHARRVLAEDPATALGAAARSVDVLVRLHTPRSAPRSDRVAVRQDRADGHLVSEAG